MIGIESLIESLKHLTLKTWDRGYYTYCKLNRDGSREREQAGEAESSVVS